MIGELIDHYRILELVGRGAMGVVYKALDVNLDRTVAIKVMTAEARGDPEFVERFRQEARLQGALNHPNIALLFDYFIHDGAPVAVMEFIDGESLQQSIRRRGPIPAQESIPIFKQALRGVAAAHRAGIIHRDLKPGNLMVSKDGIVKVMDFGIAKRQGATGATKASTSIGSPLYMAPEQILGRAVDCRTDVYALGLTLYQLLSGQPPFNPRGKAEYVVLNAHVNDLPEPPTVHCRDIPQPIVDAVMRSLAKEPDARFQSADEFMGALPDVQTVNVAPHVDSSDTVALEYSPATTGHPVANGKSSDTTVFEYAPSRRRDPQEAMAFDYSAATLGQASYLRRSTTLAAATVSPAVAANVALAGAPIGASPTNNSAPPSVARSAAVQRSRETPPGLMRLLRADHRPIAAALVAALLLGALMRHAERRHASLRSASSSRGAPVMHVQAPTGRRALAPMEPAAPRPADLAVATAVPGISRPPATTDGAVPPDLSGTWRGEYVDASGKQLLRVVSLSISRVRDDGGIEGTLQYEAASGDGECKLHPGGSRYSAGEQRLQLSPEECSPHYPRELGVPLDFDGVHPRANTLKDGRIEAPTGEVIRVKLKRLSGVERRPRRAAWLNLDDTPIGMSR